MKTKLVSRWYVAAAAGLLWTVMAGLPMTGQAAYVPFQLYLELTGDNDGSQGTIVAPAMDVSISVPALGTNVVAAPAAGYLFDHWEVLTGGAAAVISLTNTASNVTVRCNNALAGGTDLPIGASFIGLLDGGQPCALLPLDATVNAVLFPSLAEHHQLAGRAPDNFEMVQLTWPDRAGVLPFEPGFAADLVAHQLLIAEPPP
jgi:hypothetical protein